MAVVVGDKEASLETSVEALLVVEVEMLLLAVVVGDKEDSLETSVEALLVVEVEMLVLGLWKLIGSWSVRRPAQTCPVSRYQSASPSPRTTSPPSPGSPPC